MAPMTGRITVAESLKSILICVDSYDDSLIKGYIYHGSFGEGRKFNNLIQLLFIVEETLDDTGFPRATTEKRRFGAFTPQEKAETVDESHDFATKKGTLASFKLKIMFRQNASWQGSLAWLESNTEEPFRSALEMIMLMDSALTASS